MEADDDAIDPQLKADAVAFMGQWTVMVKAMLDNAMKIMEDEGGSEYHWAVQMGCIGQAVVAVMREAPPEAQLAFLAADDVFAAALGYKQDWANVVYMSEEGATSFKVIAGGNMGRSLDGD